MSAFRQYARCYDLLYRDKDYAGEARYVRGLMAAEGITPRSLLELGCGTGAHAAEFAAAGVEVLGIDASVEMIAEAQQRRSTLPQSLAEKLEFASGDIRAFDLGRSFDAATALFHVMSYLPEAGDFEAAAACVARHLAPGGLFVFDFWHGPAVEEDPPARRQRVVEDERMRVSRTSVPDLDPGRHRVDVHFTLDIEDRETGARERLEETHHLRYWFVPELEALLEPHGLRPLASYRWMEDGPPDAQGWYACMLARRE